MGSVVTLSKTVNGFDTDEKVTGAYANCMASSGHGFVGRYISLSTPESTSDLTQTEADVVTRNGLAILVVQHPREGAGGATQGKADAEVALSNLATITAPHGIIVYCDIEGFTTITGAADYVDAWATKINSSGNYKAGYYGNDTVLKKTTATWHSLWENLITMNSLPGAKLRQEAESTHTCGGTKLRIDADVTLATVPGAWGL